MVFVKNKLNMRHSCEKSLTADVLIYFFHIYDARYSHKRHSSKITANLNSNFLPCADNGESYNECVAHSHNNIN